MVVYSKQFVHEAQVNYGERIHMRASDFFVEPLMSSNTIPCGRKHCWHAYLIERCGAPVFCLKGV